MDKKEVLKKIKAGDIWLEDVDKKLQADKEVVLAAVKTSVYALQYAGKKLKADKVQIVRIEQLYPFPAKTLSKHLNRFKIVKKIY